MLDLRDHAIETVEDGAFATLRAAELDLSTNNLTRIVAGAFRDLELTGALDLRGNAIASVEAGAFATLRAADLDWAYWRGDGTDSRGTGRTCSSSPSRGRAGRARRRG